MWRNLGNLHGQAEALNRLGELATRTLALDQARNSHAEALAIPRTIGAVSEEARALEGIGHSHLHEGNLGQAAAHLQQALTSTSASACPPRGEWSKPSRTTR